jgi:SAM-dependent methyltransferase
VSVPYPPLELANRVCSLDGRVEPYAVYEQRGAEARHALLDLLPDDWSFQGARVLDFGCGAGRTLRHFLDEARQGELWGADIDSRSIAWLEQKLCPPLHVRLSREAPPLGLEYGTFDLIWALSVFTHLTDWSIPWLLELRRLLRQGGLLIATYMGRWTSEELLGEPWEEDRVGMNVLRPHQDWDLGGPMVLMSDWWVRAHWGRAFEILRLEPLVQGQSWVLMRRRDVELTVEDVERPEEGDPREYRALRHNLRQLQREHAAELARTRMVYERSRSWRLTAPLRICLSAARSLKRRR